MVEPALVRYGSWIVCPLLGAGLGWLLRAVAGWVVSLPWAPLQGPFELLQSIPEPAGTLGAMGLGVLAGLAFALLWAVGRLAVTVSDERVEWKRDDRTESADRASVGLVFVDGKELVLLDNAGAELARETSDLSADRLRTAFREHGYSWSDDGDPHAADYQLWVDGVPGISERANALLRARQHALEKSRTDDVKRLRAELRKTGVFVRDEKKHQYWRGPAVGQE
ncbi:hypothetical protein GCM10010470_24090 [Saccharopolyspora taberi]|uniref:DUF308 domain-containing protein n=1 Tax=Saccharopolyspora taberi TaxID=60895 RepID=A0ABN3VBA5_9PSEU